MLETRLFQITIQRLIYQIMATWITMVPFMGYKTQLIYAVQLLKNTEIFVIHLVFVVVFRRMRKLLRVIVL